MNYFFRNIPTIKKILRHLAVKHIYCRTRWGLKEFGLQKGRSWRSNMRPFIIAIKLICLHIYKYQHESKKPTTAKKKLPKRPPTPPIFVSSLPQLQVSTFSAHFQPSSAFAMIHSQSSAWLLCLMSNLSVCHLHFSDNSKQLQTFPPYLQNTFLYQLIYLYCQISF